MMKILKYVGTTLLTILTVICIILTTLQIGFCMFGPNYNEGEYTLAYKVYYSPNNARIDTITNNLSITLESSRGTNYISKKFKGFLYNLYGSDEYFSTSAPIEIISYTYKENKNEN